MGQQSRIKRLRAAKRAAKERQAVKNFDFVLPVGWRMTFLNINVVPDYMTPVLYEANVGLWWREAQPTPLPRRLAIPSRNDGYLQGGRTEILCQISVDGDMAGSVFFGRKPRTRSNPNGRVLPRISVQRVRR